MKTLRTPSLLLLAAVLGWSPTHAADRPETDDSEPNRFSAVARFGFNITAKVKNLGASGAAFSGQTPPNPGPATAGVDHNYDDGYNRVDTFGNDGGLTWNWGYADAGQIVGDNLLMRRSLPGDLSGDFADDPQMGCELTWARRLGRLGFGHWGFELAGGYMDLDLDDSSALNPGVLAVDAYSLGGILPPAAGHRGSFNGPGPLLSDAPTRADTLHSQLEGRAWSLRLGPYAEFPLARTVAISFSGGLALLFVDSEFQFQESAPLAGTPTVVRTGTSSREDTLVGGYAGANLTVTLTDDWSLLLGVQYQHVGNFSQTAGDKEAEIDFGKTVFATAGLSFKF